VRAAAIFNGLSPDEFDALDTETTQELEVLYRDGLIGGRAGVLYASHIMALLHALGSAFSKGNRPLKPSDFFPHLEAYFKPPELPRQERDFWAFTMLPGFKPEFLEILRRG
jgi:hypothetical protein